VGSNPTLRANIEREGLVEEIYSGPLGRVFVGDDEDFENREDLKTFSFLRCCKYGPGGHQQTLDYHTLAAPEGREHFVVRRKNRTALNMLDLDDPHFVNDEMIQSGLDFINQELAKKQKVLIACNAGRSRGPTLGLMWLRSVGDMPHGFMQSEKIFRTICPKYDPAAGINQYARMKWSSLGTTGKVLA
jgi:hypothetical protein